MLDVCTTYHVLLIGMLVHDTYKASGMERGVKLRCASIVDSRTCLLLFPNGGIQRQ